MSLRAVSVCCALSLLAGWLLASVIFPPVASLQSNAAPMPSRDPSADAAPPAPYTERLRLRLREAPAAPTPRRNPFTFERTARPAARAPEPAVPPVEAPPVETPGLQVALAGIATADGAEGPSRTAVLSVSGDVILARPGDTLPLGYQVVSVDEESVTLTDATGNAITIRLK
jgi:hypothetical protein